MTLKKQQHDTNTAKISKPNHYIQRISSNNGSINFKDYVMKNDEIPSAFPRHIENQWSNEFTSGMTLRDYFANSAMQSLIPMFLGHSSKQDIAKMSYEIADEILKQREL